MLIKRNMHGQMSDSMRNAVFIILSGGFQDAYTYCCRGGVFANAQTGNIVLMSIKMFNGEWLGCIKYLIPLLSFVIGTAVAEVIHFNLKNCERIHWRQIVLLVEIVILFIVGFLPHSIDLPANALVSFVCALQVGSFHKVRGHIYASTMCIGNIRSCTESFVAYLRTRDKAIRHKSFTYLLIILAFAFGAGFGGFISKPLGIKAIWVCCVLLVISFSIMFIKYEEEKGEEHI